MAKPVEAQVTKICALQASAIAACTARWIHIMSLQHLHFPAWAIFDDALPVQGATALHIACQTSNAAVVEVLVKHGAPLSFAASSACKVQLCLPVPELNCLVVVMVVKEARWKVAGLCSNWFD